MPEELIALIAESLPAPGPFTNISTSCIPKFIAFWASLSDACCAAKAVDFFEPLKSSVPELFHESTLPDLSVIVISVLLNVLWI